MFQLPLTPTLAQFSHDLAVQLELTNVVKILSLYQKTYDAAVAHPYDTRVGNRLELVTSWVDTLVEKYDALSDEGQVVVDMFISNWRPKGTFFLCIVLALR